MSKLALGEQNQRLALLEQLFIRGFSTEDLLRVSMALSYASEEEKTKLAAELLNKYWNGI